MSSSKQTFVIACIHAFFTFQQNVKIYHWQTKSYARHKATDGFLAAFLLLIDQMIEVLLGAYPEVKSTLSSSLSSMPIVIQKMVESEKDDDTIVMMAKELIQNLKNFESKGLTQSSVLNIRDSMVADIQQMLYLFGFQ